MVSRQVFYGSSVNSFSSLCSSNIPFVLKSLCLLAQCFFFFKSILRLQLQFVFVSFQFVIYLHDKFLLTTIGASLRPKAYPESVAID